MVDIYGIGESLSGFLNGFLRGAKRTGRTELMLNALKKDDCVVCGTQAEQRHLQRIICERGVGGVDVLVCDPVRLEGLLTRGKQWNAVYFTHQFVERFYEFRINRMFEELDDISLRLIRRPVRPASLKRPFRL